MRSENSGNVELPGERGWDSSVRSVLTPQITVSCLNSLMLDFNCNVNFKKCNMNSFSYIEINRKSFE